MPTARVHRLPIAAPDDTTAFRRAIEIGEIAPASVVAVLGKTEGNGCVNDFSRAFAVQSLQSMLSGYLSLAEVQRICMVMSGGTEGALSPHLTVFEVRDEDDAVAGPALAIGVAHTPPLPAEHIGRREQAEMVAAGVREAMAKAGLDDPGTVHFVQVKCPLLTSARIAETTVRGETVATSDTLKSMGVSRGASALGVAAPSAKSIPPPLPTTSSDAMSACGPPVPAPPAASSSLITRSWCSA